jgi:hypothetical protein
MVHQESAIFALLGDPLRTAQIKIDSIDREPMIIPIQRARIRRIRRRRRRMIDDQVSGLQECIRMISAKLDDQRAI